MKTTRSVALSRHRYLIIIIILLGSIGMMVSFTQPIYAFPILTDLEDMKINWNNSLRYNWGLNGVQIASRKGAPILESIV